MTNERLGLFLRQVSRKRGGRWAASLLDQAVMSMTSFLTGVLIARTCSHDVYGQYALGTTLVILVLDLQMALISTPFTNYAPQLKGDARAIYFGSTLAHQGAFSIVISCVAALSGVAVHFIDSLQAVSPALFAVSGAMPFLTLRDFIRRLLMVRFESTELVALDSAIALLHFALLFVLLKVGFLGPVAAYVSLGGVTALVCAAWLARRRRLFEFRRAAVTGDFSMNWATGKWTLASGIVWTLSGSYIPWLLALSNGPAAAGAWAACYTTAALANPLVMGTHNFIGPSISHAFAAGGPEALRAETLRCTWIGGLVALSVSCVLGLGGSRLLLTVYGAGFEGSAESVWLIACSLGCVTLGFPVARALFALGRADIDFGVNLAVFVLLLALSFAGIRVAGVRGAATALLICNGAGTALRWSAYLRAERARAYGALVGNEQ